MKISFKKLSTKDLATLTDRVINASKKGNYTMVENQELLKAVEAQYKIYEKVYDKSSFSGKGIEVAKIDKQRDKLFRNIKAFLAAYRKIDLLPHYNEAEALYQVFKQVGLSIDRLSYAEQTAQMKKLIEALEVKENKARLTTLELNNAFNALKDTQESFENVYLQQAEANADLRKMPSATVTRKGLEKALKNYFDLLTAMRNVNDWEMVYNEINELVKAFSSSSNKKEA